jgi:hypothetical protein
MMLAVPTVTPVTRPVVRLTLATVVLLELHVMARPLSVLPFASRDVAVACDVPTAVIDVAASATVTVATGASDTVTDDVPVFPSLVAVIVALPGPTAVTEPTVSTAATAELLEVQVSCRPERIFPLASLVTAVSCCADAIPRTRLAVAGLTVTEATGAGVTVSGALPVFPSLVAITFAVPALTAPTSPVDGPTVATPVLSELHKRARPVRTRPFESSRVAEAWVVCAILIEPDARDTVTVATGACVTMIVAFPLRPSLVAVMLVVPTATAATKPCASTVATAPSPDVQVINRPERTAPFASSVVAVACEIPTAVIEPGDRATVTFATGGGLTVRVALPVFPSLIPMI